MFLHNTSMPHVLSPQRYFDAAQFELELDRLFRPAWHVVGCWDDLKQDGAFIAKEVLGRPILVRNFAGKLHAFLNVCTHRHALLTSRQRGRSAKLVCQYHGWEYCEDGSTAKIPDAQSFKPLPGGPECLQKFPLAVVGPLVFVNLAATAPPFDQVFAPATQILEEFPRDRWRRAGEWSYEFATNWKIPVENTIESYHVPTVHPYTLVRYGAPEEIEHELHPFGGIMRSPSVTPSLYLRFADPLLRWLEPGCSHRFRLFHGYPSLFLIRVDAMLQAMSVTPIGPQRCRMSVWVFTLRAAKENIATRLLTFSWGQFKCALIRRILAEDAALFPALQKGMNSSPFRGRISAREELVYGFQEYVVRECGLATNADSPELTP
jgi:phenylpropionate dioxygenase-like ring-hydroxylating dioxygenase large terminal subunit